MKYYIVENGQQAGPFEVNDLFSHGLTGQSMVWCQGMANWQPASQVAELAAAIAARNMTGGSTVPTGMPMGNTMPQMPQNNMPTQQQTTTPSFPQQQQTTPYGGGNMGQGGQYNNPYAQPQYQQNTQVMPKTWIVESVIVTVLCALCCCNIVSLALGIVAIIKGNSVKTKFYKGDYQGANQASQSAKRWLLIALVVAIVWGGVQCYRVWTDPTIMQQILETINANGVTIPT